MFARSGVGRSGHWNSAAAGREAAKAALAALEGRKPLVVLVFATVGHDQDALLGGVTEVTESAPVVGCSAEGVITQRGSEETSHAVAVAALASDDARPSAFFAETFFVGDFARDARACGRALAQQIQDRDRKGRLLVLFPDGIRGNCTELVRSIEEAMPYPLAIIGGAAGDLLTFEKTFQYHAGRAQTGGVAALLLGGDFVPEIAVTHGCDRIGTERVVTRAENGFVCEIDGKPAWSFFQEYLANAETLEAAHRAHLLLTERIPASDPEFDAFTVRVPTQLDASTGALYFAAGIATGTRVQVARRNAEKVCERASAAAVRLSERHPGVVPALILHLDCAGRGALLFGPDTTARLIEPLQRHFHESVPWMGMHTYGEIAPVAGQTFFHNYTGVLCALYPTPPSST